MRFILSLLILFTASFAEAGAPCADPDEECEVGTCVEVRSWHDVRRCHADVPCKDDPYLKGDKILGKLDCTEEGWQDRVCTVMECRGRRTTTCAAWSICAPR